MDLPKHRQIRVFTGQDRRGAYVALERRYTHANSSEDWRMVTAAIKEAGGRYIDPDAISYHAGTSKKAVEKKTGRAHWRVYSMDAATTIAVLKKHGFVTLD